MKKKLGFTLIELMIVVAIIGILASIALPAYQTYVAKSKVTSILATVAAGKPAVFQHYSVNGKMPLNGTGPGGAGERGTVMGGFHQTLLLLASNDQVVAEGRFFYAISDTHLRVRIALKNVNGNINGEAIEFDFKDEGDSLVFECNPASTIDNKYLPKVCQ